MIVDLVEGDRVMKAHALGLAAVVGWSPPLVAQTTVTMPDWTSPEASRYLEQSKGQLADPGALGEGASAELASRLSIPVLTLRPGFSEQAPSPEPGALVDPTLDPTGVASWPGCASRAAKPLFAADETGEWYSQTYEFGCITITISGDRKTDPVVPGALVEELSDRTGDVVSTVDETDDPSGVLVISYDIIRMNVPYVVTFECLEEAATFCKDRAGHQTVLQRLVIAGGRPQP